MTMSSEWNVAGAKAELSRLLREAQREPQVIENRGRPVAVVLGVDDYQALTERGAAVERWQRLLDTSAAIRAAGGATLVVPPRRPRRSPFA